MVQVLRVPSTYHTEQHMENSTKCLVEKRKSKLTW